MSDERTTNLIEDAKEHFEQSSNQLVLAARSLDMADRQCFEKTIKQVKETVGDIQFSIFIINDYLNRQED